MDELHSMLANLQHLNLADQIQYDSPALKAHGGYCDVFEGRYFRYGECLYKVAIKRLRLLAKEIRVWSKLGHRNILPLLGYLVEGEYPSLISEWMENGTVSTYINEHPECDVLHMTLGIAEGIEYLHLQGVIHSDIKADNVLVSSSGVPRICDFGISGMLAASQTIGATSTQTNGVRGSVRWMAPELILPSESPIFHSMQTDIWAFGMTVYELLARQLPYAHLKSDVQVMFAIIHGRQLSCPASFETWPLSHQKMLRMCCICWSVDPSQRHSMGQIVSYLRLLCRISEDEHENPGEEIRSFQFDYTGQAAVAVSPSVVYSPMNTHATTAREFQNVYPMRHGPYPHITPAINSSSLVEPEATALSPENISGSSHSRHERTTSLISPESNRHEAILQKPYLSYSAESPGSSYLPSPRTPSPSYPSEHLRSIAHVQQECLTVFDRADPEEPFQSRPPSPTPSASWSASAVWLSVTDEDSNFSAAVHLDEVDQSRTVIHSSHPLAKKIIEEWRKSVSSSEDSFQTLVAEDSIEIRKTSEETALTGYDDFGLKKSPRLEAKNTPDSDSSSSTRRTLRRVTGTVSRVV
ncbi:hypothetical protein EW145_g3134 [Phellinidium pouzarii]|uniref:Protein kinase domain-containing protein n=1 Tax=Phellinidium pouzarii TaxID=167371 RepID=A0A4S4L867_9AGAM|nr:hypothetical protein EW145_g3134 [Phellinidium pouzarii]